MYDLADFLSPADEEEVFLKVLLTGPSGSGKSTSVIYGAPKPLLVFDLEKGTTQYAKGAKFDLFKNKKIPGFDPTDPKNILQYTRMLLQAQAQGVEIPYKSILLDSGTVLYKRVINDYLKALRDEGQPNKRKLEPNEYAFPKAEFYEIIDNLKKLDVHLFVTAQAADNYLKQSFMKIDPNEPVKADCEKGLIYVMDVHYMLSTQGKKHKALLKKSRIVDSKDNNLLPEVIDNFNNFDLIPMLIEHANKDLGFEKDTDKTVEKNTVRSDVALEQKIENIISAVNGLQMSNEDAVNMLKDLADKQNPYELNHEEADKVMSHLNELLAESSDTQGE